MNILLVGSGGREHAIALKLKSSPRLNKLFIAPGNGGTALLGENIPIKHDNIEALADFALSNSIDLVIAGPEIPLCLGLGDLIKERAKAQNKHIAFFGPVQACAKLEASKDFSKEIMTKLSIPTAKYSSFTDFEKAKAYIKELDYSFVIKADGLAAGKGVILPKSKEEALIELKKIMLEKQFGSSGDKVVIEERLEGEEVSILAFSDGETIAVMPPSQDHKRLKDNDEGPNTGGMGAYAPAPICSKEEAIKYAELTILPVIKEMKKRGTPYIGVLYAGLMLTKNGNGFIPKVLEYNCRFGDPETQVLMQLFKGDLVSTLLACTEGRLKEVLPEWKEAYAATVVLASEGYPQSSSKPVELNIKDLQSDKDVSVIHSGTALKDGKIFTAGGRVICISSDDKDLQTAMDKIYTKIKTIHFPNVQYRKDIAKRGLTHLKIRNKNMENANNKTESQTADKSSAYSASGVNIDAGNEAVRLMSKAVKSTFNKSVLSDVGSFGGLFGTEELFKMKKPVLVGSTDGVGTKVKIAAEAGIYTTIGQDIVNHCIDDILVQGAKPLFFLDYVASSKLNPQMIADIVGGMAKACKASDCALIGGETAEMPGVYMEGEFDIAGTIVGVVDEEKILPKKTIQAGDILIGLKSDSPHTNGYSLIRTAFKGVDLNTVYPELKAPLHEVLLTPHRSYLSIIYPILQKESEIIKGLAHITGGGFIENIPRIIPDGLIVKVKKGSWNIPPLYPLIQKMSGASEDEMYRIFNMGIGMIAVVSPENAEKYRSLVGEESWIIGKIEKGDNAEQKAITILE